MRMLFMVTTMLISVPTGIKVFAWLATLWGGKLRLTTAMLFAMGGLFNFMFAGHHRHDAGHGAGGHSRQQHLLRGGPLPLRDLRRGGDLGFYAAIYHWFPKFTGRMYYEGLGKLHFLLTFIGAKLNFLPMHPAGLMGMPRRVASYDPEFALWNVLASLGGFLLGVSTLPFILNMVSSWVRGPKARPIPGGRSGWSGWCLRRRPTKTSTKFPLSCRAPTATAVMNR
jgi:cytochrome c oxidase subunit 1